MRTVYRTYVNGTLNYEGDDLKVAIKTWDGLTFNAGRAVPGGVAIAVYDGDIQVRDGWIMHTHEDGTTFLSPSISSN